MFAIILIIYFLTTLSIAPVPLQGFKVGISRKDNPSKALEMLKTAAQKINQDQLKMFIGESFYKNRLDSCFGKYFDYNFSGAFSKTLDGKFTFDGYATEKHGKYVRYGGEKFDSMDPAITEMYIFMLRTLMMW